MTVYTVTTLDDPFANGGTSANGINNTGQIVGSYHVIGVSPITHQGYGFLYTVRMAPIRPLRIRTRSTAASPQVPLRRASTTSARSSDITRVSTTASVGLTDSFTAVAPIPPSMIP